MDESLAEEIRSVRFTPVRLREGYDIGEVDDFLDRLEAKARAGEPIDAVVADARFRPVRFREGYDIAEVDRFLEQVARRSHGSPGPAAMVADPEADPEDMSASSPRIAGDAAICSSTASECHPRGAGSASTTLRPAQGIVVDTAELTAYCLAKPGAWADNPWGHEHPVIKVGPGERGKIFAFVGSDGVGVKCGGSREEADEWLQRYPGDATAMAYIGRNGWNDLRTGAAIPEEEIWEAIDESYRLVVTKLPKSLRPAGWEG